MLKSSTLILNNYHDKADKIWLSTIYGKLGVGKSAYCLKTAFEVYMSLLNDKKTAWEYALSSLVFEPIEFVNLIENSESRVPLIILDDASFHLGSSLYKNDYGMYSNLKKIITTIRTRCSGLMINAPSIDELAKFLRGTNFDQIKISKYKNYNRFATGYKWYTIQRRTGPMNVMKRKWRDEFTCYLPNDVYKRYQDKRNSYLNKPIEYIKESNNG